MSVLTLRIVSLEDGRTDTGMKNKEILTVHCAA